MILLAKKGENAQRMMCFMNEPKEHIANSEHKQTDVLCAPFERRSHRMWDSRRTRKFGSVHQIANAQNGRRSILVARAPRRRFSYGMVT
jgi:hypothetical protein